MENTISTILCVTGIALFILCPLLVNLGVFSRLLRRKLNKEPDAKKRLYSISRWQYLHLINNPQAERLQAEYGKRDSDAPPAETIPDELILKSKVEALRIGLMPKAKRILEIQKIYLRLLTITELTK